MDWIVGSGAALVLGVLTIWKFGAWLRDRMRLHDQKEAIADYSIEDVKKDLEAVTDRVKTLEQNMTDVMRRSVTHGERIGSISDLAVSVQQAQRDINDKLDKMVFLLMDLMKRSVS